MKFGLYHYDCNSDVISISGKQKHIILETEPCDFLKICLKFRPFESHFLVSSFFIKKICAQRLRKHIVQ